MNALIQKEVRLLWPSFAAALVLSLGVWLMPNRLDQGSELFTLSNIAPLILCPAMVVMMALNSFGREFSAGTFQSLLAQPVPRSRIWWTKILLLGAALAVILAVWMISFVLHFREKLAMPELKDVPLARIPVLFVLVVFSGGLWTTLLFRQVTVAFWFTLLTPALLLMLIEQILIQPQGLALTVTFLVYSVVGLLIAHWLFFRAQDKQWSGGVIALPGWRSILGREERATPKGTQRQRRPRTALFIKEWRLHQSQFIVAAVLVLLHLSVLAGRRFGGHLENSPFLEVALQNFWTLWLLMPWLVGCAAVAEERKLGTWEAQLCLPARHRSQFWIKFGSTLFIAVLLGAIVPLLLEGRGILPDLGLVKPGDYAFVTEEGQIINLGSLFHALDRVLPFLTLAAFAGGIAAISFYASTFSRNTLQAMAPGLISIGATGFWWFGTPNIHGNPLWQGWLGHYIGVPVLVPVLIGLMYWNFKRVPVGWPVWRRNLLVLLGSFLFVLTTTTFIYHRTWELFSSWKPEHDRPVLTASRSTNLKISQHNLLAQLSDGRVWLWQFYVRNDNGNLEWLILNSSALRADLAQAPAAFLEGTNWIWAGATWAEVLGLRADGTLWISARTDALVRRKSSTATPATSIQMKQLGNDADWKRVCLLNNVKPFLIKNNGTLWELAPESLKAGQPGPLLSEMTLRQLGTDTDWEDLFTTMPNGLRARKQNGTSWSFNEVNDEATILSPTTTVYRTEAWDGQKAFNSTSAYWMPHGLVLTILQDGSFRLTSAIDLTQKGHNLPKMSWEEKNILLSPDTNWLNLAASNPHTFESTIALKADGSLWKWKFTKDPLVNPSSASATRLGRYSGWVALAEGFRGVVTLAADGSLWLWHVDSQPYVETFLPVLAPSRRPQFIGNIFAAANGG